MTTVQPYGSAHRWPILVGCVTAIALHGGLVYGWPSMRTMLRRESVLLAPGCTANSTLCAAQELSFGVIYTAGAWSNQAARLLIGVALDHIGPRITGIGSALLCGCGSLIFAFSHSSAAGLTAGFFLIGGGGGWNKDGLGCRAGTNHKKL